VFYHKYPTRACPNGNVGVRSLWDNVAASNRMAANSREEAVTISIKWSGARVGRYVSTAIASLCESLINVVINDKPKMLTGLNQKVSG
jgi:hypothetical protein